MWRPGSATELASVGDDYQLLLWDTHSPGAPASKVGNAHGDNDLHCVDWSALQPELLVTGEQALLLVIQSPEQQLGFTQTLMGLWAECSLSEVLNYANAHGTIEVSRHALAGVGHRDGPPAFAAYGSLGRARCLA